jgi:hypothetical protein
MKLSDATAARVGRRLRRDTEEIAVGIAGLVGLGLARDAEKLAAELCELLTGALAPRTQETATPPKSVPAPESREIRPRGPYLVTSKHGVDEIEEFLLDLLAANPREQSVQAIAEALTEAELVIKRGTLVVRLHRMVQAGKLTSPSHGYYSLSDVQRSGGRLA